MSIWDWVTGGRSFSDIFMAGMQGAGGNVGLGLAWDTARMVDDDREKAGQAPIRNQILDGSALINAATAITPNFGSGIRAVRDGALKGGGYALRGIATPFTYASTLASGGITHVDRWAEGEIGLFSGRAWTESLNVAVTGDVDGVRSTGLGLDTLKQQWNSTEDWNPDGVSMGEAFTALQDNIDAPTWLAPVAAAQWAGRTTGLLATPDEVADITLSSKRGTDELKDLTRGEVDAETGVRSGDAPLKMASGYFDFTAGIAVDPLNVLGPVAKVGKAATLGKATTTVEDGARISSKIDAHTLAVQSQGALGEFNEYGRFVDWVSKEETTAAVLRNDPRFKSREGQRLAEILGRTTDWDQAATVIKAGYGDEKALADLKDYSARFHDMLDWGKDWDEAGRSADFFSHRPKADSPLETELVTPWGIVDDVEQAAKLWDDVLAQEKDLSTYLDDLGFRYSPEGDRLGVSNGIAIQQQASRFKAVEKRRQVKAERRGDRMLGDNGSLRTTDIQPTKFDRVYRLIHWAGDEVPNGWVDFNRADSDKAFAAELRGAGKIRGTEHLSPADRQYWYDEFLAARGESAKRDVVVRFEQTMVEKIATHHGVDVSEAKALYSDYNWARTTAQDALTRTGAMPDQDGVINLMSAHLRSTLANRTPVMDFRMLDSVLKRNAMSPKAQRLVGAMDGIGHTVAESYDLMKANVLLRFGYPIRNVTDSTLRSMAQLGAMAVWAPVVGGQVASNFAKNRGRDAQRMLWQTVDLKHNVLKGDEAEWVTLYAEQDALGRVGDTALNTLVRDTDEVADEAFDRLVTDLRPNVTHPAATMTRDRWVRNRRNHPEHYEPWVEAQDLKDSYLPPDRRNDLSPLDPRRDRFTGDLREVQQTAELGRAIGEWYRGARTVAPKKAAQYRALADANPNLTPEQLADRMTFKNASDRHTMISFEHMRRETAEQYDTLVNELGIEVEVVPWDVYEQFDAEGIEGLVRRLKEERKIYVLSTEETGGHPYFTNAENDMFRAVHDVFGHAAAGRKFDRHGEEAAYVVHSQMFSDAALPALVPETRGQNAYLNYISGGEFGPQKLRAAPPKFSTREPARVARNRDHEEYVIEAIQKGERVPPNVLDEYPHLKGREQLIGRAKNTRYVREAGIRVTDDNIDEMLQMNAQTGGFTFDPRTGKFASSGYAIARNSNVEDSAVREIKIPVEDVTPARLKKELAPLLPTLKDSPTTMVGGWTQDGYLYFELTDVVTDFTAEEAMRLGRARNQLAIYDIDNGQQIQLRGIADESAEAVSTAEYMQQRNALRLAELEGRLGPERVAQLWKAHAEGHAKVAPAGAGPEDVERLTREVDDLTARAAGGEDIPRSEIGRKRSELAVAKRKAEQAGYVRQLREERLAELKERARIGTADLQVGQYTLPGALGDEFNRAMAGQASADNYRSAQFASTVSTLIEAGGAKKQGQLLPSHADYYKTWADAVNRHLRGGSSPVPKMLLEGQTPGEVARWLERTTEGRAALRAVDMGIADDVEGYVTRIDQLIDDLTMGDASLRAHFADGPVHEATLKSRFPKGTPGLQPIQGNVIADTVAPTGLSSTTKAVTGRLMHWLGTLPEDRMARHPFYSHSRDRQLTQMVKDADARLERDLREAFGDGTREQLEAQAAAAGWNEAAYRLTNQELLDLQRSAGERALTELKDTLYSVVRRNNFAQAVRFLSPFYLAWENSVKTWGRLVANNPGIAVWGTRVYNAPNKAMTVVDEDGNDRASSGFVGAGERIMLTIPKGFIDKVPNVFGIKDGLESMPQQAIPKDSLNMILQGEYWWQPGASWFVSMPANEFLSKQAPQLEKDLEILLGPGGVQSGGTTDMLLSGWQRRLRQSLNEDSTIWQNTYNNIAKVEFTKFQTGERETAPDPEELIKRTRGLLAARVAFSATLPYSPQQTDEFSLFRDEYRRLLEENGGNVQKAEAEFYDRYGDDYFMVGVVSLSQNNTGAQPTLAAFRNSNEYASLIADVVGDDPKLVGLLVNDPSDQEFSNATYRWQYNRPVAPGSQLDWRSSRSGDDVKAEGERRLGWLKWNRLQEEIRLELENRGLTSTRQKEAEDLRAAEGYWRDRLQQELPGWRDDYKSFDGSKSARRIEGLRKILSNEAFARANGDDPVWKSTAAMVQLYGEIQQELRNRRAADPLWPSTLESEDNADLEQAWDWWTSKLTLESPEFADVYDQYFSAIKVEVV